MHGRREESIARMVLRYVQRMLTSCVRTFSTEDIPTLPLGRLGDGLTAFSLTNHRKFTSHCRLIHASDSRHDCPANLLKRHGVVHWRTPMRVLCGFMCESEDVSLRAISRDSFLDHNFEISSQNNEQSFASTVHNSKKTICLLLAYLRLQMLMFCTW
jgi:hypothetical protein